MQKKTVRNCQTHQEEWYGRARDLARKKKEQGKRLRRPKKTLHLPELLHIPRHDSNSPLEADHLAGLLKSDCQRFVNYPAAAREYSDRDHKIIIDRSGRWIRVEILADSENLTMTAQSRGEMGFLHS